MGIYWYKNMRKVSRVIIFLFIIGALVALFCAPLPHTATHCNDVVIECPVLTYFDSMQIMGSAVTVFFAPLASMLLAAVAMFGFVCPLCARAISSSPFPPPRGHSYFNYLFSLGILHGKVF